MPVRFACNGARRSPPALSLAIAASQPRAPPPLLTHWLRLLPTAASIGRRHCPPGTLVWRYFSFLETTMRIRKPHRNTTVRVAPPEENVPQAIDVGSRTLQKVWEDLGDGRPKSSTTTTTTTTVTPELPASTGLESLSSLSRQASPGVSMQQQRQQQRAALEDGSNLSVDQLWQAQDGEEQTPRHYVRRCSNVARKEGIREEEMSPEPAVGASKRKLHTKHQTETDPEEVHPSAAPEGSLLQTLYLQLLAAGSEGITLRDLFTSFKKQTALLSFDYDWKEQVRSHLKSNPHFDEVKGHYLLCTQLLQRPLKHSPAAAVSLKRPYTGVSPRTTNSSSRHVRPNLQFTDSASAAASSVEKNHEGVQTRRKAYEKTIEAVLTESAMEFERMQQASSVSPRATTTPAASDVVTAEPADSQASRKRKSSSETEELDGSKTIRGSLQALQAKILAETGQQKGEPCARKDDARKWRCPLMAMEGHTLCEHHRTLQVRKKVRKQEECNNNNRSRRELTDRLINKPSKPNTESSPEQDDNNGAHAVETLVDLQAQPRQAISLNTVPAEDDDDANQADEEAESEVVINHSVQYQTAELPYKALSVLHPVVAHRHIYYEKAIPGSLKALQAKIISESGAQSGVRCARKDGSNDSARKWQCPLNAMEGHTLCEHHNFLKERKRARYAAAAHTRIGVPKRRGPSNKGGIASNKGSIANNKGGIASNKGSIANNKGSIASSNSNDEVPLKPVKLSEKDGARSSVNEKMDLNEPTDTDDLEPVKATKDNDDDDADKANAELVLPRSTPKRWYVAAKKTAAVVEVVKEKSQEREASPLIRPPTIPPLPALYGVRRKAVKNRSLLSL